MNVTAAIGSGAFYLFGKLTLPPGIPFFAFLAVAGVLWCVACIAKGWK